MYEIHFKRLASEISMDIVLRRPYSDEIEDYREYKRIRQAARLAQEQTAKVKRETTSPIVTISSDGASDVLEMNDHGIAKIDAHNSILIVRSQH